MVFPLECAEQLKKEEKDGFRMEQVHVSEFIFLIHKWLQKTTQKYALLQSQMQLNKCTEADKWCLNETQGSH